MRLCHPPLGRAQRFLEDGRLLLDNNRCEQQMRDLCRDHKNAQFCGSHEGARRAAILYSITRTCAVNGIDAMAYASDVLRRLAAGWPNSRVDELLPENWSPQT